MSTDKDDSELDDDLVADDSDNEVEVKIETPKSNMAHRRVIDNLLEERRLQRQLAELDFDV